MLVPRAQSCRIPSIRLFIYPAGMERISITSTPSPGKMVKCGWFRNSVAAAS